MIRKATPSLTPLALIYGALCMAQSVVAQNLPVTPAETLDGKKLVFPTALRGSLATCVFGFGQGSSDKVGVWLEALSGDNVNAWSVVNLETVASVARGPIRVSMRVGTPPALRGRSLIIAKDYKEWKKILEIHEDNLPVVALFDGAGKIVWKRRGTFSASIADELKAHIAQMAGH